MHIAKTGAISAKGTSVQSHDYDIAEHQQRIDATGKNARAERLVDESDGSAFPGTGKRSRIYE